MIGVIQAVSAPYRDKTFIVCKKRYNESIVVATFPDNMDIHPEWEYEPMIEDYYGTLPQKYVVFGRTMAFNPDIKKWVRSEKWDALLLEGYNSLTNIYALLYAFVHRIPVILGVDSVENPGYRFLKSKLYKLVSAFWVPGARTTEYLISEGVPREKVFQGKYTYDLEELKNQIDSIDRASIRRSLNINETDIVLLFVGKLIPTRNVSLLLRVFSAINNDNLRLIIIGDGPDERIVDDYSDNRLIHIPKVPLADLYNYYAISDIYVHPGSEPYSLAVVQAVASDVLVVSSKAVGAVDDVLVEDKNGYIYTNGSFNGLLGAMNKAIEKKKDLGIGIYEQGKIVRRSRSIEFSSYELHRAISFAAKGLSE